MIQQPVWRPRATANLQICSQIAHVAHTFVFFEKLHAIVFVRVVSFEVRADFGN